MMASLRNFDHLVHNFPGALECLKVVREVSERCLGAMWVTLDTGWGEGGMMCKQGQQGLSTHNFTTLY